jgi:phenylalanyl-tRNA synthetase beta chain
MRVPVSWLKDYVNIGVPLNDLAERLTLAGLEVETIEYIGLPEAELPWDPERIVVGELRAVRRHPNADRLVLAEVVYGGPESEVVVTGAPSLLELVGEDNLHLKVAFAMEGSQLYDGHAEGEQVVTLRQAKIRGVHSRAMVCSEKELGLSEEQVDILYLPDDAPIGTPLAEYMGDAVLEFDIKGPFAHLNSVVGIAREAAALLNVPLKRDALEVLKRHPAELVSDPDFLALDIVDPDLCPRYSAAFIAGVEIKPSPFWMQLRLRRAGVRPISNVVDVTNYVMLELGQPLHAFDYHLLRPRPGEDRPAIIVRRAQPGEQMKTLDGELRTFDDEMLLITDGGGPVAVAGVMGGQESEVSENTTVVLLESANFDYLNVRRTSRMLGMNTDASQRFGRRVDPELTAKASARAAHLMADLAGGEVAPVIGDLYPGREPPRVLAFDPDYAGRILGVHIPAEEIVRTLTSLEFDVSTPAGEMGALKVTVPSHRRDVTRSIDLVEEVGRIWGYDRFPTMLMRDELPPQRDNPRLAGAELVRDLLVGCGLDEVITYSLVSLEEEGKLHPGEPSPPPNAYLQLLNPLSSAQDMLRQTLLPSLFRTARENLRFLDRVAIFEIGRVYRPVEGQELPEEPRRLAIAMTGPREGRSWLEGQDRSFIDFFDLKGVVESLVARLRLDGAFKPDEHDGFHPGRCARVIVNGEDVGVMGEVHPLVREAFGLPEQTICALEFDLDALLAPWGAPREMIPLSTHPPVYEDLALVVDEDIPAVRVRTLIASAGMPLLRSVALFDVYRGAQVGAGKKSLAYRLTYQAEDRTLTDKEVADLRSVIVQRLEAALGAALRG